MSPTRLFLLATGFLSIAIGAAYLVAPASLAALGGLEPRTPLGLIEVRGFYGGQLMGLGAFILLGAWRSGFATPALLVIAATLGGTALGRLVGFVASGSLPANALGVFVLEIVATVAALLLARRREGSAW